MAARRHHELTAGIVNLSVFCNNCPETNRASELSLKQNLNCIDFSTKSQLFLFLFTCGNDSGLQIRGGGGGSGQLLMLVGSAAPNLGDWDPPKGLRDDSKEGREGKKTSLLQKVVLVFQTSL